tara:strand:+ start:438 stop:740 length:303 start_codon:yes stop_codon:yes gene_type:complete
MAKRKSKKLFIPPGPEELSGYRRGDLVYCRRYPDDILSRGEIKWFHEKTELGPAFTFMCESTGAYRLALLASIIENPTKAQKSKINNVVLRRIKKENKKK